jgi:thiol-disulfide isomerase/thioredoxin
MGWPRPTIGACALVWLAFLTSGLALGETVLLDFDCEGCMYCRMMDPVIKQLADEGYPIRKVHVEQDPALVEKFKVEGFPTFIALRDGREVGRVSGRVNKAELVTLLARAGVTSGERIRGQSPDTRAEDWQSADPKTRAQAGGVTPKLANGEAGSDERLLAASVRLRIKDGNGQSTGSGTIVDARDGEALILTCGHVFREFKESQQVLVDLFGASAPKGIPGKLVCYDLKTDVGLVRVQGSYPFAAAPVAPAGYRCRTGDVVKSVGCDSGDDATVRQTKVVSIDRYNHGPNLQVAFEPVQGRSGGGLFSREGYVIGVCNAADPADKQGLFAAIGAIHAELDRAKLSFVYNRPPVGAAPDPALIVGAPDGSNDSRASAAADDPPASKSDATPVTIFEYSAPVEVHLSPDEQALLEELRDANGSEIICLVRSLTNPNAKSKVLQLNRASPAFWRELAAAGPASRRLTSLDYRRDGVAAGLSDIGGAMAAKKALGAPNDSDRIWPPRQRDW